MKTARVIAALGLAACLSAGATAARAADLPVAPAAVYADEIVVARPLQIWQGHFTGGRNLLPGAQPTALDWIDATERFASLPACGRWMAVLKRQYSRYEGWRGCLRIR